MGDLCHAETIFIRLRDQNVKKVELLEGKNNNARTRQLSLS